jgi:hypothetical protein
MRTMISPSTQGKFSHLEAAETETDSSYSMKNKKGEIDEVMAITGSIVAFDKPLKINRETQEVESH